MSNEKKSTEEIAKEKALETIASYSDEQYFEEVKEAVEKQLPPKEDREDWTPSHGNNFINHLGRNINNYIPEEERGNMGVTIERLNGMIAGKYRNNLMLHLLQEMPVGGYGF